MPLLWFQVYLPKYLCFVIPPVSSFYQLHVLRSCPVASGHREGFCRSTCSSRVHTSLPCCESMFTQVCAVPRAFVCHALALLLLWHAWLFPTTSTTSLGSLPRARGCVLWSPEMLLTVPCQRSLPPDWNWDFHHCYGYFFPVVSALRAFTSVSSSIRGISQQLFVLVPSEETHSVCFFADEDSVRQPGLCGAGQVGNKAAAPLWFSTAPVQAGTTRAAVQAHQTGLSSGGRKRLAEQGPGWHWDVISETWGLGVKVI